MTDAELSAFESEWKSINGETAVEMGWRQIKSKLENLVEINPRHAGVHYRLGQVYQQLGQFESAKHHLILAKEEDVCPLRIVEPMYAAIGRVAKLNGLPIVDVKAFFEGVAPDGIPGRESMLDHVHPTIFGHQQISELLLLEMIEQGWVDSSTGQRDCGGRF